MTPTLKIDFVSDISCPWCAIGLASLERALERVRDEVVVDQILRDDHVHQVVGEPRHAGILTVDRFDLAASCQR